MPFSGVTGMRPDLIINPHAFPSRMTIAMLLESIAANVCFLFCRLWCYLFQAKVSGYEVVALQRIIYSSSFCGSLYLFIGCWLQMLKIFLIYGIYCSSSLTWMLTRFLYIYAISEQGGALHGKFVDATPFSNTMKEAESESSSLVDEIGSMLTACGFNHHVVEVLYSGVYGTELICEIFIGPVYYQRLPHMVSDKFQVRSTGQVDQITRQPLKGRKRGGGVYFGEMERDSLLAHGATYFLHDRLHTSSDHHIADVCSECGSVLTSSIIQLPKRAVQEILNLPPAREPKKVTCLACRSRIGMENVAMPYVFKYLAAELAAMNIKMTLKLSNGAGA